MTRDCVLVVETLGSQEMLFLDTSAPEKVTFAKRTQADYSLYSRVILIGDSWELPCQFSGGYFRGIL